MECRDRFRRALSGRAQRSGRFLAGFDLTGPDVFGVAFTRLPLDRLNQENQKIQAVCLSYSVPLSDPLALWWMP